MDKQEIAFAVVIRSGEVVEIGRSYIEQPEIQYDGRNTKRVDDALLLKKGGIV